MWEEHKVASQGSGQVGISTESDREPPIHSGLMGILNEVNLFCNLSKCILVFFSYNSSLDTACK